MKKKISSKHMLVPVRAEGERRSAIKEINELKTHFRTSYIKPFSSEQVNKKAENISVIESSENDDYHQNFEIELKKGVNKKDYIMSLFPRKIYAELYFAWCKDCSENITVENAKYFRDELLLRNNKDIKNFNFKSLRVNKNFLLAFIGNLENGRINKLDLSDNLISDVCMHNIKSIISIKKVVYLNLASNMISTEGIKIIQTEVMTSDSLKYLNLGVVEGSFRRNNLSGEGGLIIARILLSNECLSSLILQDNELGEESADKIGSSLIQNRHLNKILLSDNKIRNKGAKSILENGEKLVSLNLSNNEINSEICLDLKRLLEVSTVLQELNWDSNNIGLKGIRFVVEGLQKSKTLKYLSLKNTNIGNNGIKLLSEGLKNNKCLETLDISSNSITYESFTEICDMLLTNQISCIKSQNNLLGDESMKYFSNVIINPESTSSITYFDFSSSKIYDQGLIYLLNELTKNFKIKKMKLRDNYFSHEIDYVVIDFIEKNTHLTLLDLSKNRFSFQCLQKIQKIIERNIKIQNDKEPNKLLVEVYRLKYENTKLNEMKESLKYLESDVEKMKLNRADIRQDYETFKHRCDEDFEDIKKKMEKNKYIYAQRQSEYEKKLENVAKLKQDNQLSLENMNNKIIEMKERRQNLEEENEKIAQSNDQMEKDFIIKIEKINNLISNNKKMETERNQESKSMMEEIIKLDKLIKEKMKK